MLVFFESEKKEEHNVVREELSRRTFVVLGATAFMAASLPSFAFALPQVSDEVTRDYDEKLAGIGERIDRVSNELASLGGKLERIGEDLAEHEHSLELIQSDIVATKERQQLCSARLAESQDTLGLRIRASYKQGRPRLIEALLDSSSFEDLISQMQYFDAIVGYDRALIDEVEALRAELLGIEASLEVRKQDEEATIASIEYEQQELTRVMDKQEHLLASLSDEERAVMAQRQEAVRKEQERLAEEARRETERLERERAEREESERRTAPREPSTREPAPQPEPVQQAPSEPVQQESTQSRQSEPKASTEVQSAEKKPEKSAPKGGSVVDHALAHLGKPYRWGGTGPNSFDCSGLMMIAYRGVGRNISRTSRQQYAQVKGKGNLKTRISDMNPGDLVFFATNGSVHHVGMALGGGTMVHAPHTGAVVRIQSISSFGGFVGGGKP